MERFLVLFSKMWKKVIYKIDKIEEKAKPCSTLIFVLKNRDMK